MTGKQLRQARQKEKYSPEEFATLLGISYPTLMRLENTEGPIPRRYRLATEQILFNGRKRKATT